MLLFRILSFLYLHRGHRDECDSFRAYVGMTPVQFGEVLSTNPV